MPLYDIRCESCGHAESDVFAKMNDMHSCSKCGGVSNRVPVLSHTDLKEFHTPIEMFSIAMEDPAEIKRFAEATPDVGVSLDPDDPLYGVPVARNRSQKRHALATAGFVEKN